MQYKTIVYERSKGDNYNRQSLRFEVQVGENEDLVSILDCLTATVDQQLGINSEILERETKRLEGRKLDLTNEIENIESQLILAKERIMKAKLFLEKNGIPIPGEYDHLPF
ncbi:hypothetical protein [Iningainema tapete]|uniref:Uncharacterized protein n=1 Tax=Iningainema tapete BLCC-T55 TaxID=2748662 RepID=A0A8J7CFP0_9CYAN|nr:hypothetical protein [Iningainema tapete]MBD2775185.1 hypothetical protein [Iningainema tapete BLCC-T55]